MKRPIATSIRSTGLAVATALLTTASLAQEDPFGAAPKRAADTAAPKAPVSTESAKPEPLAIQLLRASNPTTPRELLQAAQSALEYGRPDETKRYLAKLLADKPTDENLATLTARFADFLLQLDRSADLQPEGKQVAELIYSAARRVVESPDRIAKAIVQLSSSQPRARQDAIEALDLAGIHAVNPMLHALADSNREAEHASIRTALVQLGRSTELPLIAALDSPNVNLRKQVMSILGRMGSTRAAAFLMRPALDSAAPADVRQLSAAALFRIAGARPDAYEAAKYLSREIARFMNGDLARDVDIDGRVRLWQWNPATQEVTPTVLPRLDAGMLLAAKLANDLYTLRPDDQAALRLMLLTNLELAKVLNGLERPLPVDVGTAGASALAAGPRVVKQLLAEALREGRVAAAIAAAEVLGLCGDSSILQAPPGGSSPLTDAMTSSDRRVRLAAALSAVKLAPGQLFPGAGRVAETLAWFLETNGRDVVLIGHPRGEDAQSLVGFMSAVGYEGEGVYVGRGFAERAFSNPDYPFLLIADSIDQPPVLELVQWLRRDFRTARQPIGIMARGERFDSIRDAFRDDPFTTVFPRIHSTDIAAIEVEKLKAIAGRNLVRDEERMAQGRASIDALTMLARNPATFAEYDLLHHETKIIRALNHHVLSRQAAELLALYGTPGAQAALINFATQSSQPLENRQAAAVAFASAVKSHGLRLTVPQVAEQLARYQAASATKVGGQATDEPTRELLASLVKAIEAPAIARGELLKQN